MSRTPDAYIDAPEADQGPITFAGWYKFFRDNRMDIYASYRGAANQSQTRAVIANDNTCKGLPRDLGRGAFNHMGRERIMGLFVEIGEYQYAYLGDDAVEDGPVVPAENLGDGDGTVTAWTAGETVEEQLLVG